MKARKGVKQVSEKEKQIAESIEAAMSNLPDAKKEYLLGVAEGMAVMAERQKAGSQISNPPNDQGA